MHPKNLSVDYVTCMTEIIRILFFKFQTQKKQYELKRNRLILLSSTEMPIVYFPSLGVLPHPDSPHPLLHPPSLHLPLSLPPLYLYSLPLFLSLSLSLCLYE